METPLIRDESSPHAAPYNEVLAELEVSQKEGLAFAEVEERREKYGANTLRERERKSFLAVLADQFTSLVIALLVGAAGVSFVFGEVVEAAAILVVVLLNAAIGFVTE
ncbi:MAG: cation-transporting P-type ATPase, partial [Rubrobacteraceae bacterium]